jgi:hypothetical protein
VRYQAERFDALWVLWAEHLAPHSLLHRRHRSGKGRFENLDPVRRHRRIIPFTTVRVEEQDTRKTAIRMRVELRPSTVKLLAFSLDGR